MFLNVSCAAHVSGANFLVNHGEECHKVMLKTFGLPEKFRKEALLMFLKVLVVEEQCVTGVSGFFVNFSCLTVPKIFAGEPFCNSKNFWYRKSVSKRGSIRIFREKFCLTVPKIFLKGTFWCL